MLFQIVQKKLFDFVYSVDFVYSENLNQLFLRSS